MASGLVLYFGDMLAYTIAKVIVFLLLRALSFSLETLALYLHLIFVRLFKQVSGFLIKSDMVQYGSKTSEINIIIQVRFFKRST